MHPDFRGACDFVRPVHEVQIVRMLSMLWKNFWGGHRTLQFPARPNVGDRFRGLVEFDPALCSGCAVCKFRCTSRAIDFKGGKGEFTWSYDPGQCTFCGRCVEGCKEHALSQREDTPPVYTALGELKKSYTLARKTTVKPATGQPAAGQPAATAKAVPAAAPTPAPAAFSGGAE
jgi:formate hydrogenlyase subunit 6/NADH:ubiquinone oxidoreductase subunit I